MDYNILTNIKSNKKLNEKLENIISLTDTEKKYRMSQTLLEYININLLMHLKKELEDYDIITIMIAYKDIDSKLYNLIMAINADYNEVDEESEIQDYDLEDLLIKIDDIYGYMISKYGNFINEA